MITAFSEQLITIDELRARMPALRARETGLKDQIAALDAQAADRDAYLKLAGDLEGFLARLRGSSATATVEDRQRVLRAVVQDVLVGPRRSPSATASPSGNHPAAAAATTPPTRRVTCAIVRCCVGGVISPLLANVYLHHVLDLWAVWWRNHHARGDMIIVRFADHFVAGFQYQDDAERFQEALRERFAEFSLELHPGKTRLIEFGRFASPRRKARGAGKPETFAFLGFTHICAINKRGQFWVRRITDRKRLTAKLAKLKAGLLRRRHDPVPDQGIWLASVINGHMNYCAVPGNGKAVRAFREQAVRYWYTSLRRRSQKTRLTWERMGRLASSTVAFSRCGDAVSRIVT